MSLDFSSSVSRQHLHRSLVKAIGREDVQIRGEPKIKKANSCVDGFTSIVLRVAVSYGYTGEDTTTKTKFFVVKCIPKLDLQINLVRECNLFVREGRYLDEVVPIMQEVSKDKVEMPLPSCYHAVYQGDSEAIYMEDLLESGFQSPATEFRAQGIDLQHCLVAMKSLGKLHALAISAEKVITPKKGGWLKMIPELSRDGLFYETLPGEENFPLIGMIDNGIANMRYVAKHLDGLPKEAEISGKLEMVSKRIWDTLVKLVKPARNGRNLLNHGDCWINNFMFRYEKDSTGKQKPVDAKFIDFQIARYCHPSIDLLYFIYMGTTKPFRERHLDRLFLEYYDSLEKTLKVLNVEPPPFTLDELKSDYHGEFKPFGIIIGVVFGMALRLGKDFLPTTKEVMSPEECQKLFETGNASIVRERFDEDPEYRIKVEDAVKEFVDMAFPNGLENIESSPLLQ